MEKKHRRDITDINLPLDSVTEMRSGRSDVNQRDEPMFTCAVILAFS